MLIQPTFVLRPAVQKDVAGDPAEDLEAAAAPRKRFVARLRGAALHVGVPKRLVKDERTTVHEGSASLTIGLALDVVAITDLAGQLLDLGIFTTERMRLSAAELMSRSPR